MWLLNLSTGTQSTRPRSVWFGPLTDRDGAHRRRRWKSAVRLGMTRRHRDQGVVIFHFQRTRF
jgi:hypothetical protein